VQTICFSDVTPLIGRICLEKTSSLQRRSPAVLERWVMKIAALEEKKRHYEAILRRELDGLDDEFGDLKLLSQELSIRARGLRFRQAGKNVNQAA